MPRRGLLTASLAEVGAKASRLAMTGTVIALFKTEFIRRLGPWRSLKAAAFATLGLLLKAAALLSGLRRCCSPGCDRFHDCRLLEPIGKHPPAPAEAAFCDAMENEPIAASDAGRPAAGKPGAVHPLETSKGKLEADGTIKCDLALPTFGYRSRIGIDRRHGFRCRQKATDGAAHEGARLREGLIDPINTASDVWGAAYRSTANEEFLADPGRRSQIRREESEGKPMPRRTAKANAKTSAVRAEVAPVVAPARAANEAHHPRHRHRHRAAEATSCIVSIAGNPGRWRWWQTRAASP